MTIESAVDKIWETDEGGGLPSYAPQSVVLEFVQKVIALLNDER